MKKILIFGNGLDCTYNKFVQNFNQEFKNFISLENESKMYDALDYYDNCKCENSSRHFESIINELRKNIDSLNEDVQIEDVLFNIGKKIIDSWENSNVTNKQEKINEIFHVIQNLFGTFVCYVTTMQTIRFKVHLESRIQQEIFDDIYRPNLILTTNYTNSAECIADYLTNSSSLYAPIETKYIHGKIKYPISDDSFKTLQINLRKKNEGKLNEVFKNFDKNEQFQVKIFGLSVKNDSILFRNLILNLSDIKTTTDRRVYLYDSYPKAKENELIYYYFNEVDKKDFLSFIKKDASCTNLEILDKEDNLFKIRNSLIIKVIKSELFEWNQTFIDIDKRLNI